jgi:hypothetical protein
LSFANTPGAADRRDRFLVAAELGRARGDQLEAPALLLGEAMVHPQKIAGEQSGFVAAGAGADLEHRGALVCSIARQQLHRQRALRFGKTSARCPRVSASAISRSSARRRVRSIPPGLVELGAKAANLAGRGGDRLDRGIFLGQLARTRRARGRAAIASASSCLRASIDAIRSDEIWSSCAS